MLAFQVAAYAIALWLGCYLLARRPLTAPVFFTGAGLIAYAAALAVGVLADTLGVPTTQLAGAGAAHWLEAVYRTLLFVPALCWCVALSALTSDGPLSGWRSAIPGAILGAGAVAVLIAALAVWLLGGDGPTAWLTWLYAGLAIAILFALLVLTFRVRRAIPLPRARALTLLSALFFGLGGGLLLLGLPWLPPPVLVLGIGADLLVFGWAIAALDAFDAGERLRADFTRSIAAAALLVTIFGGQVLLALVLGAGPPAALTALLLGVLAAAIALPAFWDLLQRGLDRIVFGAGSPLGERRAALAAAAGALPRQPADSDLLALPEDEFVAITRRALSQFGDLPKLAASPLTRLPIVEQRLRRRGASGDVLERAAELKALLAESIARLKPADGAGFGTTDEWRHYNALYFPYVAGLRPYSRRPPPARTAKDADARSTAALDAAAEWFRAQVPERTLHNWQRAAARLVALDLRELAADGSAFPSRGSA